jgi:hypothetical protein
MSFLPVTNGCWFLSKDTAINKIEHLLGNRDYIDRAYVNSIEKHLPKAVTWAIEQIGVESAFTECDSDRDGRITIHEMRETDLCLSSCMKLTIINSVL